MNAARVRQILPLEAARRYRQRKMAPIPVPPRAKSPNRKAWQRLILQESDLPRYFNGTGNVGILTGTPSAGMVDVDLDAREAVLVAQRLLPATGMIHGRRSKPASHWWYVACGAKTVKFEFIEADMNVATMLVELRADGCQTIVPPSQHPNGEWLEWIQFMEAAQVDAATLHSCVAMVAAAALIARHWPGQGSRDNAALALCGMLGRAGWNQAAIDRFARAVAEAAGDEEWQKRGKGHQTLQKLNARQSITGIPTLVETLRDGERVVSKVQDWLALKSAGANNDESLLTSAARVSPTSTTETGKWHPTTQTLVDLMAKNLPPTRYILEGIIPEGVTLLGAKPKKGKTTLMMHIGCSVVGGCRALGSLKTEQTQVLYMALEDNERRMQRRMRQMHMDEIIPNDFHISYAWAPLDHGGLDALNDWLDEHSSVGLVIIDTLEHIRPARRMHNGVYADDYSAIRGLQRLAGDRQIAIVAIHHLRKAPAEDPFDEFNGSTGLIASVDNAIVLRTVTGMNDMLELHRRGRDFEDDTPLAIKGDRSSLLWKLQGTAQEALRSAERQAIVTVLKEHPGGLAPKDIAQTLDKNHETTRVLLMKMLHESPSAIQKVGDLYTAV